MKENTVLIIDKTDSVGAGGTTTTESSARKCFFDAKNHQVLNDCVPLKVRSETNVFALFLQINQSIFKYEKRKLIKVLYTNLKVLNLSWYSIM